MTSLTKHQSNDTTKLLLIGNSGSGKTGSLASLAKAGYRLMILDYDNGLDILKNVLKKEAPDKIANIFFKPLGDDVGWQGMGLSVKKAEAFQSGMKSLAKWIEDDGTDMGSIWTWGPDTILVVDSLTHLSRAAMSLVLSLNNRLADGPTQSDWYDAQCEVENMLAMLYAPTVKCNVIVMAHIDTVSDEVSGAKKGVPMTLGKALGPKVPTYFNSMIIAKTKGIGDNATRIFRTTPDGMIDVKYPLASGLPAELPISTGLATIFRVLQEKPKELTKA